MKLNLAPEYSGPVKAIFVILADFSYFGTNAQNFHNTNFGFNSIIFSFVIPFIHSKVL
jgi:hypothetical protein